MIIVIVVVAVLIVWVVVFTRVVVVKMAVMVVLMDVEWRSRAEDSRITICCSTTYICRLWQVVPARGGLESCNRQRYIDKAGVSTCLCAPF